jgi:hypothetical protein
MDLKNRVGEKSSNLNFRFFFARRISGQGIAIRAAPNPPRKNLTCRVKFPAKKKAAREN